MIVNCKLCNKEFKKANNQIKKTKNNFCSKSCAAIFNNQNREVSTFRQPEGCCYKCNTPISKSRKFCKICKIERFSKMTLKDMEYQNGENSNRYGSIRARARYLALKNNMNKCAVCGYDKHVEIAHIKPISEFEKTDLIESINNIDNLIALCPNCHWEFDNNLLKLATSSY